MKRPTVCSLGAACGIALATLPLDAAIISGPIVNPANGHTYFLLSEANWTQSENEALGLNGHLVTINNQMENDWVYQTFAVFGGTSRALWIGLTDRQSEGNFVWASGEASTFTLWSSQQPDNGQLGQPPFPAENFVHMLWPGHPEAGSWNDFQDMSSVFVFPLNGVVEVVPEPHTYLLFLAGLILMFGRRYVHRQPNTP